MTRRSTIVEGMEPGRQPLEGSPETTIVPEIPAPATDPEGIPPEQGASEEEYYDFRWRDQESRIPRRTVGELAKSVNAPSEEAVINWMQRGRDYDYLAGRLNSREQELETREQAIAAYEARLRGQSRGRQPQRNGYGEEHQPPQGYRPREDMVGPDPNVEITDPRQVVRILQSLPGMFRQLEERVMGEVRSYNKALEDREAQQFEEREMQVVRREAESFIKNLKDEGWKLPDDFTEERLIREVNRYGLSYDPNITWADAFEMVAGRLLYRTTYRLGQRKQMEAATTDRKAEFRVPAGRSTPSTTPETKPLSPAEARAAAAARARKLGEGVSLSEALGNR